MKSRPIVVAVALALLMLATPHDIVSVASTGFPAPVELNRQYWGTFYYPWYGNATDPAPDTYRYWAADGHHPPTTWSSNYLPDDGSGVFDRAHLYGSMDRVAIDRHLTWMERARFDFAAVSWRGPSSYDDRGFSVLLGEASRRPSRNLSVTVYYELEGYADPPVERIVSDLIYIHDKYASSSAFFTVPTRSGRIPVVFVYGVGGADYALRWARARAVMYSIGRPVFIVLGISWSASAVWYRSVATLVDGWHIYGAGRRLALVPGYAASASPSRTQVPELGDWPLFPRDAVEFAEAVRAMARLSLAQAKFLLVPTFNEWREGTQIEPGFPIHHNDSAGFTQAGPSYGFLYVDVVGSRGALLPPASHPSAPGCIPPPPGLVSWWPGDGTPEDVVGFNLGTLYDGVSYADGRVGRAFRFGGADDWVLAPGMGIVDLQQFTIDFWVKLNSMPPGEIERFVTLTWAKAVIRYDGGGPGQLHFYMDIDGELRHVRVNDLLEIGAFHHVAGTYDGRVMRLYFDGVEVGNLTVGGVVGSADGVALSQGDSEGLDGLLDEVQVFDRALAAQEIGSIFGAGGSGMCRQP